MRNIFSLCYKLCPITPFFDELIIGWLSLIFFLNDLYTDMPINSFYFLVNTSGNHTPPSPFPIWDIPYFPVYKTTFYTLEKRPKSGGHLIHQPSAGFQPARCLLNVR